MTAEQFFAKCPLKRTELVCGRVVEMRPRGFWHGAVVANIASLLHDYDERHAVGRAYLGVGFRLSSGPDTVRFPNVSFVRAERLPGNDCDFLEGAPDIAVDAIPFDEKRGETAEKVREYIASGTRAVWLADTQRRTITVYAGEEVRVYSRDETLRGEPVLPGCEIRLSEIFDW